MENNPKQRYLPSSVYNGRKERDGFVCGSKTMGVIWCVAVKIGDDEVHIRDTKDMGDTTLSFTKGEWAAFVEAVKLGEFDVVS